MYSLSVNQIDLDVFIYELAPSPTSIFEDSGESRIIKSKKKKKIEIKSEVSSQNIQPDAVIIGGGGMPWAVGYSAVH